MGSREELIGMWQTQVGFLGLYLVNGLMMAHAVLGLARTAATRLPVPHDSVHQPLFAGDYTLRLYCWSSQGRKLAKMITLGVLAPIFLTGTMTMLYFSWRVGYVWAGGQGYTLPILLLNVVVWIGLAAYANYRGATRANPPLATVV